MDIEEHPTTDPWEKVTRKMVDPITFTSHVNIAYVPRLEDCEYETTCYGLAHPRFGEGWNSGSTACTKTSSSDSAAWLAMDFSSGTPKESISNTEMASCEVRSRSKSVSVLSKAERSKAEKELRDKKSSGGSSNADSGETESLPVLLKQQSTLKNPDKDDEKSLTLDDAVEKKLRFTEGHTMKEIPCPTDSMYDDLFYCSEELADFLYEAFLEEAGQDVNEYTRMAVVADIKPPPRKSLDQFFEKMSSKKTQGLGVQSRSSTEMAVCGVRSRKSLDPVESSKKTRGLGVQSRSSTEMVVAQSINTETEVVAVQPRPKWFRCFRPRR